MTPDWLESLNSLPKDEAYRLLESLPPEDLETIDRQLLSEDARIWVPQPGRQREAYYSEADELFYGGAQGGGKSDLLLGLAATQHHHAIIFRRIFTEHRALIERSRAIFNAMADAHVRDRYNESLHRWMLDGGQVVEFGAVEHEKDKEKWRGRPHDFYGWDEVCQFTESQFRFVNAWCRSVRPGQRCRIVATGNPPSSVEGEWVIRFWAPWLDRRHTNPALPGELRWFVRINDEDVEVDTREPFETRNNRGVLETVTPRSRTFIPALLSDNPILEKTGYLSVIQNLPEPLRSQALYGDFTIGLADDQWQVIPSSWVRLAQQRWTADGGLGKKLSALGVDPNYGGRDACAIVPRRETWFGKPVVYKGSQMRPGCAGEGEALAALIVKEHEFGAAINIDVVGWGAATYESLKRYEHLMLSSHVNPVNGASATNRYDKSKRLPLVNIRAALYWNMREALDPIHGQGLALPPDREMEADLCSARWELTPSGIKIEPKEDIKERIGRSPDVGDATCLALWLGGTIPILPDPMAMARAHGKRDAVAALEPNEEGGNARRRGLYGR